MRRLLFVLLLFGHVNCFANGADGRFFVGYNQPWFGGNYGTDLSSSFDAALIDKTLAGVRSAGGGVVRVFLFTARQGLKYADAMPTGITPEMLGNVETLLKLAAKNKLKVYVTPLQVGEAVQVSGEWRRFYENILQTADGARAYDEKVMRSLLEVLDRNRDAVFGLDLANEIDATIRKPFWAGDARAGVRGWVAARVAFVKAHSAWLKTSVSVGWGGAQGLITDGLLSGLGLDFYDLHVYSDSGSYPGATALCARAKAEGMPIILGEYGQSSKNVDDELQVSSTKVFLGTAANLCFSGALAWTFEARQTPWWAFQREDGSLRPAVDVVRQFSKMLSRQ